MDNKKEKSLNELVTDAVRYLMKSHRPHPLSQGALSKQSGVSQGTICMNLKRDRGWSLDVLERICKALGTPPETVIAIGRELQSGESSVFPWLAAQLVMTAPHTIERLQKIVQAVAPEGTDKGAMDFYYTAEMLRVVAPEYVHQYVDGNLTDREVYTMLEAAQRDAPPEGNMWGPVKARLNPNGEGPYSPAPQSK